MSEWYSCPEIIAKSLNIKSPLTFFELHGKVSSSITPRKLHDIHDSNIHICKMIIIIIMIMMMMIFTLENVFENILLYFPSFSPFFVIF